MSLAFRNAARIEQRKIPSTTTAPVETPVETRGTFARSPRSLARSACNVSCSEQCAQSARTADPTDTAPARQSCSLRERIAHHEAFAPRAAWCGCRWRRKPSTGGLVKRTQVKTKTIKHTTAAKTVRKPNAIEARRLAADPRLDDAYQLIEDLSREAGGVHGVRIAPVMEAIFDDFEWDDLEDQTLKAIFEALMSDENMAARDVIAERVKDEHRYVCACCRRKHFSKGGKS